MPRSQIALIGSRLKMPQRYEVTLNHTPRASCCLNQPDRSGTECRKIQNDHDQGKKMKTHRNSDADVHSDNRSQTEQPCSFWPNQDWKSQLEQANGDPEHKQQWFPMDQCLIRDQVKGRPGQRAPHAVASPPACA